METDPTLAIEWMIGLFDVRSPTTEQMARR